MAARWKEGALDSGHGPAHDANVNPYKQHFSRRRGFTLIELFVG